MKLRLIILATICQLNFTLQAYAVFFKSDEDFKKVISKNFPADKNTQLQISNKMGDIKLDNWQKNEVAIEVTITVKEDNKEKADKIFNKIEITVKNEGNNIQCNTEITDKINNADFNIDYKVTAPAFINIDLSNKFGNIIINEINGKAKISVKYGTLEVLKITDQTKPYPEINLGYCNSSKIKEINTANLNIKYSKLKVEKSQDLIVSSKYSSLKVENASSIIAEAGYDNYKIGEVQNIVINGKYSDFEIEKLSKKGEFDMVYGSCIIENLLQNFEEINGILKYNKIKIGIEKNASLYIDTEAGYAGITHPEGELNVVNNPFSEKVFGWIGKDKNSKSKIKIKSEYGDIKIYFIE